VKLESAEAVNVVTDAVDGVVAPTVPLILIEAVPVKFVTIPLLGVPKAGVTKTGLVANTLAPVPVSSVSAVASCADVNEPSDAALPTLVTAPVRFALVVTLPAVKLAAVPVMFVPTSADGVPSAGVTSVGLVANTLAPVPVSSVSAVASCADVKDPRLAALPTLVIAPVRFALVVTVEALPVTEPVIAAVTVNPANVPTDVNEDAVTPAASVAPLNVPAGATTATVVIPVVNPFALIVTTGMAVDEPVVPAVATVASVNTVSPLASPE
jgi:hypothetical protein